MYMCVYTADGALFSKTYFPGFIKVETHGALADALVNFWQFCRFGNCHVRLNALYKNMHLPTDATNSESEFELLYAYESVHSRNLCVWFCGSA